MAEEQDRELWRLGRRVNDTFRRLRWAHEESLASATEHSFDGTPLRLVSPVAFIATKYAAFIDRGGGDFYASHDLEDLITVIDGRAQMVLEVRAAPPALRGYVCDAIGSLLASALFRESLPGHLPTDRGSQERLSDLRRKLREIAALG